MHDLVEWVRRRPNLANAEPVPASTDASFRRYFRVQGDASYIVMDAPPQQEDCRPFVKIAGLLEGMDLNSVRVLAKDYEQGFLLLSDLGSVQYLEALRDRPHDVDKLYGEALNALLMLQAGGARCLDQLPPYDEKRLRDEMLLFEDWLCGRHLGLRFSTAEAREWRVVCDALITNALAQPLTMVHRDFHSRNLMASETDKPGILDFQDAVAGPYSYDLVSLLKDCYIKWPAEQIERYAQYFRSQSAVASTLSKDAFFRDFNLMGVQRHLKASGIFARLLHRDGKHGYMHDVPRTLSYIVDIAPQYEELNFLGEFVSRRVLPALEQRKQ